MSAGKGDTYRPVMGETYRSNYDSIFNKKKVDHHLLKKWMDNILDNDSVKVVRPKRERYTLVGSNRVLLVHPKSTCAGQRCCIHNPSDHHMKEWPQNWREDRGMMERICPHGIGHPDPDDPKTKTPMEAVHGCDGCCSRFWAERT
jgi:hypothetical protein